MTILLWIIAIDLIISALIKIAWIGQKRTYEKSDAICAVIVTAIYAPALIVAAGRL